MHLGFWRDPGAGSRLLAAALLAAVAGFAGGAAAQGGDPAAEAASRAKAAAYDADAAAAEARAAADEARRAAEEAEALAGQVSADAAPGGASTEPADAAAEARAAAEEARQAAAEARAAAAAARGASSPERLFRKGLYVGAGGFWAPEIFDTSLGVDDSRGLRAQIGYRFDRYFAAELRGDWLDEFELRGGSVFGDLDGWSVTANLKVIAPLAILQPYVVVGVGAFVSDLDFQNETTGQRSSSNDTVELFRIGGGADIPLSDYLFLNLEGAYHILGGDLQNVEFGVLGAGLTYVF